MLYVDCVASWWLIVPASSPPGNSAVTKKKKRCTDRVWGLFVNLLAISNWHQEQILLVFMTWYSGFSVWVWGDCAAQPSRGEFSKVCQSVTYAQECQLNELRRKVANTQLSSPAIQKKCVTFYFIRLLSLNREPGILNKPKIKHQHRDENNTLYPFMAWPWAGNIVLYDCVFLKHAAFVNQQVCPKKRLDKLLAFSLP